MTAHGDPFGGSRAGTARLGTTCLRALADIGRPVPVRELLARLNPRPAQGDGRAWAQRHEELTATVAELADAGLVHVHGGFVELSHRPDVQARVVG